MIKNFNFTVETPAAMPGVMHTETFTGQVQFPTQENEEYEEPQILILFRNGVECRVPPVAVSIYEWAKFANRIFDEALVNGEERVKPAPRYDWSKAPEWARFIATDKSGVSWAYEYKPEKKDFFWDVYLGSIKKLTIKYTADWAESLEERPK